MDKDELIETLQELMRTGEIMFDVSMDNEGFPRTTIYIGDEAFKA